MSIGGLVLPGLLRLLGKGLLLSSTLNFCSFWHSLRVRRVLRSMALMASLPLLRPGRWTFRCPDHWLGSTWRCAVSSLWRSNLEMLGWRRV